MNEHLERIRQDMISEQKNFITNISKGIEKRFKGIQETLDAKVTKISSRTDELRYELDEKDTLYRWTFRFLWIGIILGLFLGGVSVWKLFY